LHASISNRYERQSSQNTGFENAYYRNRFKRMGKLLDQGMNTEAGNEYSIVCLGTKTRLEILVVDDGLDTGLYVLIIVDARRRWLRCCVCADRYGLERVS
jgi:hypothetical protein